MKQMPSDCGQKQRDWLVGIMKLVFQHLPVEDGVRLLTPRRNRTDSYFINAFAILQVWE